MKTLGNFKRGDSFAFYANLTDKATGDPIDIDANLIMCQVRNSTGKLYATLDVSKHAEIAGRYLFQTTRTVTSTWPASQMGVLLYVDIQFTLNDVTSSTETFSVNVMQDVTKEVI